MTAIAASWDEARAQAHSAARPPEPVPVALAAALGTILAKPLVASMSLPAFDSSAMDGYAVRGDPPWTIVGAVQAGQPDAPPLTDGAACEVATGVPVPPGTTAVLPYERATRSGLELSGRIRAGDNIRRRGEECEAGEQLLPPDTLISPQVLGLAAALGHDRLCVQRAPRVSALVTGDELRESGLPGAGQVRDAIGPMLPGLIAWAGGTFVASSCVTDSRNALIAGLAAAPGELLLVSGSSSVGPADHLRRGLDELGGELIVDGVNCRPGHPQTLARLPDGRLVVGLPGNPLAALVAFLTLALPAITGFRGGPLPELPPVAAPSLTRSAASTLLVPVLIVDGVIQTLAHTGSAMLRGVALADAVAVVPPIGGHPDVRLHPLPTAGSGVR